MLEGIGRRTIEVGHSVLGHVNLLGAAVIGIGYSILHPHTVRMRELTAQFEQVCLNAIPVVALVTLLIGVVIAYLLGLQAEQFGANIFVVDGVGIGATREFAPIIVAVIVAGRSGAAFTAQLGSMRLTEETDAIRTLGLSPLDVLVLPRVIALMIAMPLLVFVGDVMSLVGAMLIAQPMLDITPTTFVARLRDTLDISHPLVGLAKAPVFALVIAQSVAAWACRSSATRAQLAWQRHRLSCKASSRSSCSMRRSPCSSRKWRMRERSETIVEVDSIVTRFGEQTVHDGVSFKLQRGTLTALIGGSGTGKSVLLREIIGLQRPSGGRIRLLGTDVWRDSEEKLNAMRRRFGMMFQDGALFSSMTVAQNVAVPLVEHARATSLLDPLIKLRLAQAGLGADAAEKMPSELSGGMRSAPQLHVPWRSSPKCCFWTSRLRS